MEIAEEHRNAVGWIAEGIQCAHGFDCFKAGSVRLPRVREVVPGKLVECLEDTRQPCAFAVDFGTGRFCECPVLDYIRTRLGIEMGSLTD